MSREKLILHFEKDGRTLEHIWVIKKGIRGARDSKKIVKLVEKWGSPVQIIGSGSVATLLRKEYKIYNKAPEKYGGVSTRNILTIGADVTGVSPDRLKDSARRLKRKIFRTEQ